MVASRAAPLQTDVSAPLAAYPLGPIDAFSLAPIDRLAAWLTRLADWLGVEDPAPAPRAATAASCVDPQGRAVPCNPLPAGDGATCIDPNGNRVPCAP